MDEKQLLSLIANGEGAFVEFKREIDLASARGKAEFVKDIIALANTSQDVSYLIVGVEDSSSAIVGFSGFGEEQIQQIAHTYISPMVKLAFYSVLTLSANARVGIIEVRAGRKPHKVARTIDRILQDNVFVRHGSVVFEASPEEIVDMHSEAQATAESRKFINAAERHKTLGNLDNAVRAYTEAIQLSPTANLFFERGKLYEQLYRQNKFTREEEHWSRLAFDDYSAALKLSDDPHFERNVRLRRWWVFRTPGNVSRTEADEIHDQEVNWLKANLQGRDLGEVLFVSMEISAENLMLADLPNAIQELDQILELGYEVPDVYAWKAEVHFHHSNYGLALKDVEKCISIADKNSPLLPKYLELRAIVFA